MSKGEQTRQMILEKAAVVFNHKGYHAASLSDLMKSTGLEKGGIYNHFGSKDDLAIASLEYIVDEYRLAFAEVIRGQRRAVERLEAIFGVFRRVARGFPVPGGCPIMNTAIEADFAHPHLSEIARKAFDEWRRFATSIVRGGIERGELKETTDAEEASLFIISSLEGAVMLASLYRDPGIVDGVAQRLSAYLRESIRQ